jgi:hypothetical protein
MKKILVICLAAAFCACGGGDEECSKDGLWQLDWISRASNDPGCPSIDPSTMRTDEPSGGDDCPTGCSCSLNSNESECTAQLSQSCPDSSFSCEFGFDSLETGTGECTILAGGLTCVYDIDLTWRGD